MQLPATPTSVRTPVPAGGVLGADGEPLVYPSQLSIRNTFIEVVGERPFALDEYMKDRKVKSWPQGADSRDAQSDQEVPEGCGRGCMTTTAANSRPVQFPQMQDTWPGDDRASWRDDARSNAHSECSTQASDQYQVPRQPPPWTHPIDSDPTWWNNSTGSSAGQGVNSGCHFLATSPGVLECPQSHLTQLPRPRPPPQLPPELPPALLPSASHPPQLPSFLRDRDAMPSSRTEPTYTGCGRGLGREAAPPPYEATYANYARGQDADFMHNGYGREPLAPQMELGYNAYGRGQDRDSMHSGCGRESRPPQKEPGFTAYGDLGDMEDDYEDSEEEELPPDRLPSRGSAGHHLGQCKPCAFINRKGCENGLDCVFCHLCEPGEKKRRKKEKMQARSAIRRLRNFASGGGPSGIFNMGRWGTSA